MSGYGALASYYDRLMTDVDYNKRAEYLLGLMARHGCPRPKTLLDLACGSGNLTGQLARRGIDMIGVDGSADMLAEAQAKQPDGGSILYLQQDMRQLDLYGTVSGAVCALDSLNHICCTSDLREIFRRLALFVEPGGLLVFDVNTPYKHRIVLADNAFVFEEDDFFCVWRNRLLPRTCEVDMQLDFFVRSSVGYNRLTDHIRERAYTPATWRRLLENAGFEWLALYGDMTVLPPAEREERVVIVAKNRKETKMHG